MTGLNNSVELTIENNNQPILEKFIEDVSNKLMINETYFGNLLLGLTGIFSIMIENQQNTRVKIEYNTDYQYIKFIFTGVSHETINLLTNLPEDLSEHETLFAVINLADKVEVGDGKLTLDFYIGAMNHDIYNLRKSLLNRYFIGSASLKSVQDHDKF